MAHNKGRPVKASGFNSLVGTRDYKSAYDSSTAASNSLAALWGVGYGDRGYGQTTLDLKFAGTGSKLSGEQFKILLEVYRRMAKHQGISLDGMVVATEFNTGKLAVMPDFSSWNPIVDENRLKTGTSTLSATPSVLTIQRATGWNDKISCKFRVSFTSEDQARYFFNTGGQITVSLSHADISTPQNTYWNDILSALGTISIGAHGTTRSGVHGNPMPIGYYEMSTTATRAFDGFNLGAGVYNSNEVYVILSRPIITDLGRGGQGVDMDVEILLADDHGLYTAVYSDAVAAGTTATIGYKKAAFLNGILAPTITETKSFA